MKNKLSDDLQILKYLFKNDANQLFSRYILKKIFPYSTRYFFSFLKKKIYRRKDNFYFYNLPTGIKTFKKSNTITLIGFSYCHKPLLCPARRFSSHCFHDNHNPVCQECFINMCYHSIPSRGVYFYIIPTVHYIGEKIFELLNNHPNKKIFFIISACHMSLTLFARFAYMTNLQGIGIKLEGKTCQNLKAFYYAEKGIKPFLTNIDEKSQKKILSILRQINNACLKIES